jgi:hypothetical protein
MDVRSGRWCVPRLPGAPRSPVPVAVHLEQFAPLLVQYFGERWWRRGSLSVRAISTTYPANPYAVIWRRATRSTAGSG